MGCPNAVYFKLLDCWAEVPSDRPRFSALVDWFGEFSKLRRSGYAVLTSTVEEEEADEILGLMASATRSNEYVGGGESDVARAVGDIVGTSPEKELARLSVEGADRLATCTTPTLTTRYVTHPNRGSSSSACQYSCKDQYEPFSSVFSD
jgi:hypothetical protein